LTDKHSHTYQHQDCLLETLRESLDGLKSGETSRVEVPALILQTQRGIRQRFVRGLKWLKLKSRYGEPELIRPAELHACCHRTTWCLSKLSRTSATTTFDRFSVRTQEFLVTAPGAGANCQLRPFLDSRPPEVVCSVSWVSNDGDSVVSQCICIPHYFDDTNIAISDLSVSIGRRTL
jgi:hypothetical protein